MQALARKEFVSRRSVGTNSFFNVNHIYYQLSSSFNKYKEWLDLVVEFTVSISIAINIANLILDEWVSRSKTSKEFTLSVIQD